MMNMHTGWNSHAFTFLLASTPCGNALDFSPPRCKTGNQKDFILHRALHIESRDLTIMFIHLALLEKKSGKFPRGDSRDMSRTYIALQGGLNNSKAFSELVKCCIHYTYYTREC